MHRSGGQLLSIFVIVLFAATVVSPAFAIDEARRKLAARGAELQPDRTPGGARSREGLRIAPPAGPRWSLGVRADNLETGVVITQVVPRTAAWRAGLETRDRIVSVNGFQVGYVGRQLYDISRELNLRADRRGVVRLLVWNHRNGELVNLDVSLDRPGTPAPVPMPRRRGIQGSVAFQATVSTNQSARVVVELLDITERLKKPKQIATQDIPFRGQTPVEFFLQVDPNSLAAGRRYELKARLLVNGRTVLSSLPGSYMLTRANAGKFDMIMKPVRFDKRR